LGTWVGGQKIGIFHISQGQPLAGEWAQAYHCGGGAAGLGLRGADSLTVCAAVQNGAGEGWGGAQSMHTANAHLD